MSKTLKQFFKESAPAFVRTPQDKLLWNMNVLINPKSLVPGITDQEQVFKGSTTSGAGHDKRPADNTDKFDDESAGYRVPVLFGDYVNHFMRMEEVDPEIAQVLSEVAELPQDEFNALMATPIDEVSKETLKSYQKKAVADGMKHTMAATFGKDGDVSDHNKKADKRLAGLKIARKKLGEEVEEIDEADAPVPARVRAYFAKEYEKYMAKLHNAKKAVHQAYNDVEYRFGKECKKALMDFHHDHMAFAEETEQEKE